MTAILFAILNREDGSYYTHGYPGSWNKFPKLQLYQNRSGATRQANKLRMLNNVECVVVPMTLAG